MVWSRGWLQSRSSHGSRLACTRGQQRPCSRPLRQQEPSRLEHFRFSSPLEFPLFFIETFFDRRKIYCSATKIYQYLLKRKKKPIKVMSDWKQHETATTNDDTQNSPRYYFVEC
jgi:hypothetical protein